MKRKENFRGPELKLNRAETHIVDLHDLLKRFMEAQTYRVVADFEREPGFICWTVRGEEVFPHDEFAPIIGDVIHNLRDALDLAVSVIMRNAGESDEHVMFPTADTPNGFGLAVAQGPKKPEWPKDLVDVLETRVQPYKGGNGYLLRTLHKLAILDKHRMIVPTAFGTVKVVMVVEGMKLPFYHFPTPLRIKDGTICGRVLVSEFPHVKVNDEADLALDIAFTSVAGPLEFVSVEDALRRLYQAVEEAVDAMRVCL
jgi:hypothetical protein